MCGASCSILHFKALECQQRLLPMSFAAGYPPLARIDRELCISLLGYKVHFQPILSSTGVHGCCIAQATWKNLSGNEHQACLRWRAVTILPLPSWIRNWCTFFGCQNSTESLPFLLLRCMAKVQVEHARISYYLVDRSLVHDFADL